MATIATRWTVRVWVDVDLDTGEITERRAAPFHEWGMGFRSDAPGDAPDTASHEELSAAAEIAARYLGGEE